MDGSAELRDSLRALLRPGVIEALSPAQMQTLKAALPHSVQQPAFSWLSDELMLRVCSLLRRVVESRARAPAAAGGKVADGKRTASA